MENAPQKSGLWWLVKDGINMSDNSLDNIERELKTQEAAELLGLSPSTRIKWRRIGDRPELPSCKPFPTSN